MCVCVCVFVLGIRFCVRIVNKVLFVFKEKWHVYSFYCLKLDLVTLLNIECFHYILDINIRCRVDSYGLFS